MSLAAYQTHTPTKPSSVRFQGDVPPSVQRQLVEFSDFHLKDVDFARSTGQRLALTEASVFRRAEDAKLQSRLVYETTVAQGTLTHPAPSVPRTGSCAEVRVPVADMTNRQHTLHGGCTAFLVDV